MRRRICYPEPTDIRYIHCELYTSPQHDGTSGGPIPGYINSDGKFTMSSDESDVVGGGGVYLATHLKYYNDETQILYHNQFFNNAGAYQLDKYGHGISLIIVPDDYYTPREGLWENANSVFTFGDDSGDNYNIQCTPNTTGQRRFFYCYSVELLKNIPDSINQNMYKNISARTSMQQTYKK